MTGASIFVGRTPELEELERLAKAGASLVTLWGPGGAGKTRLAREHARREEAGGARVAWADLASARSRADVTALLASALGVSLEDREDATKALSHSAAAQRALVIADNVEQIDEDGRRVLVAIARAGARVIVTSRDAVGAKDEQTIAIGALPEADAVELFTTLGGGAADDTARAIVQRLDAMPLAIELAAARVPVLGAQALLARLDRQLDVLGGTSGDRHARHATLRATVSWSWDLLDEADQIALAACALFEGPFDAALAEAVIPVTDASALDSLDSLDRLRRRALVHAGPADELGRPTLRLLESVRDFVREAAAINPHARGLAERYASAIVARCEPLAAAVARGAAAPPELSRRRADLARVAGRSHSSLASAKAALALATLSIAVGPLDTAIAVASKASIEVRDAAPELAARLDLAAAEAWRAIGKPEEALALAERAAERGDPDALRVRGSVRRALGDLELARSDVEAALARFRQDGDRAGEAMCLGEIGALLQSRGRLAAARERHAQAIAIQVALGARSAEGAARSYLAVATHRAGDAAASIALHEEALAIHREVGRLRLEGAELLHLGFVHHELGSPGRAREALDEARSVLARAGARGLESFALVLAARLDVDEGDLAHAMVHLAQAAECAPSGWTRLEATRRLVEGHLALARADALGACAAYEAALGASREVEIGFEALTPAYLAVALRRLGKGDAAAELARARAAVSAFENPWLAVALDVLAGEPIANALAVASSSEVRRALSFVGVRRALRVADDAAHVVLPDGRTIDLSRRKNVRLVLRALVEARRKTPGLPLDADALVAAGWPGEQMRADAATKRLHTAIWTLRSLGLGDVLLTKEEGYCLDPSIALEAAPKL